MRTQLLACLAVVALAGVMLLGGCVSKTLYQECRTANEKMNEQLRECTAKYKVAMSEKRDLGRKVETAELAIRNKDAQIDGLAKDQKLLKDGLSAAQNEIALLRKGVVVPPPMDFPLPQPVDKALRTFAAANPQLVEYLPKYGMVKFKSDLTFDKGKDFVRPAAREALAKFVTVVNTPVAAKFHVYVAGHTDDIPIKARATRVRHPTNWYLSVHRAEAVRQVLADAGMVDERIGVMGFGEYHPIVKNAPNKGGARANRRVEIWIVPPDRFMTAAKSEPEPAE